MFLTFNGLVQHRLRRLAVGFVAAGVLGLGLAPVSAALAQGRVVADGAAGLPGLGDVQGLSLAAERRLGDQIARSIYRDPDYWDDPVLGDYLQSIWQPLLAAAQQRGDVSPALSERLAWVLLLSRDRRVNAFALPGGYLGVHLGLIAATDSAAELASVLAHELSHVSQRHIARLVARQDSVAPWVMGALILSVLAARANTEVASAAMAGSQAVVAQTQLNFSREMEREADRVGLGVLTDAGFDGLGFVTMFEKLLQASRLSDDGSFPYLRSHPLSTERMADMRARLPLGPWRAEAQTSATPAARGGAAPVAPALHGLMAARARVLAESGPDRLRAWLHSGQAPQAEPGAVYAAAWSAMRLGQTELALALVQRLQSQVAASAAWAVDALWLELLLTAPPSSGPTAAERTRQLATLRDAALAAGGRSLTLLGAQAALASGEPQRAAAALQSWVVQQPGDALAWQTLARAYQAQGQTLRAVRAEAESRVAQLDYAGAVERLKAAQALPGATDAMELAIVDSRLRAVEGLLRESLVQD